MSTEALPITPARFAEALKDLSLASLHLKVLELRNNIVHLDYSNEQLRPFAEGRETVIGTTTTETAQAPAQQGDQDCIDAIAENEGVIERMQERISLIRAEVEGRGSSWTEFQSKEELEDNELGVAAFPSSSSFSTAIAANGSATPAPATNGVNGHTMTAMTDGNGNSNGTTETESRNPWTDGTFQMGTIRNGEIHMDAPAPRGAPRSEATTDGGGGGRLTDEELRRMLEERLAEDGDGGEGGMHL